MAKQIINAFGETHGTVTDKVNANFAEIYTALSGLAAGLKIQATNPDVTADPNSHTAVAVDVTTDSTTTNPGFTNEQAVSINLQATNGRCRYGGGTNAKTTFIPLNVAAQYGGAGQKFAITADVDAYGMGDSFLFSNRLDFAGGPIAGDEAQALQSVSYLRQQPHLNRYKIAAVPPQATIDTVSLLDISASKNLQNIRVASSDGVVAEQWVIVGQEPASGTPNLEPVQVIAANDGILTGQFFGNHPAGTIITPALVLDLDSGYELGQDRVLINLSAPAVSAGRVVKISGGQFIGEGTQWVPAMVGQVISLDADTFTGPPFEGSDALRSCYQITGVQDATHLSVHTYSAAGDRAYRGKGPDDRTNNPPSTYKINPAARVLGIKGNRVICEVSADQWQAGDNLELAICPYPDVSGYLWQFAFWTPGLTPRAFLHVRNAGARALECGVQLDGDMRSMDPHADPYSFVNGYYIRNARYGFRAQDCEEAGLLLDGGPAASGSSTDKGSRIQWHPDSQEWFGPVAKNVALTLSPTLAGTQDLLEFVASHIAGRQHATMKWSGEVNLANLPTSPAGLASGDLWRDVAAGNVLKIVT